MAPLHKHYNAIYSIYLGCNFFYPIHTKGRLQLANGMCKETRENPQEENIYQYIHTYGDNYEFTLTVTAGD